jgi:hypothetical protein
VQVFYAGLDDFVILALQVTFILADRQGQVALLSHRTVG